jgi:hypothetical protein
MPDGKLTDELIHDLYLYGDEDTIRKRLSALHVAGTDEILTGIGTASPLRDAEREGRTIMEILASMREGSGLARLTPTNSVGHGWGRGFTLCGGGLT